MVFYSTARCCLHWRAWAFSWSSKPRPSTFILEIRTLFPRWEGFGGCYVFMYTGEEEVTEAFYLFCVIYCLNLPRPPPPHIPPPQALSQVLRPLLHCAPPWHLSASGSLSCECHDSWTTGGVCIISGRLHALSLPLLCALHTSRGFTLCKCNTARIKSKDLCPLWLLTVFLSLPVWAIIVKQLKWFPPPQLCPLTLLLSAEPFFVLLVFMLHVASRSACWQGSGATCSFPSDVFNWAALIAVDSEEVTWCWDACLCDNKPVHQSVCSFTRLSSSLSGNHCTRFGRLPHAHSPPSLYLNSSSTHLSCDGLKGVLQPPPGLSTVIRCSQFCWQPRKELHTLTVCVCVAVG